MREIDAKKIRSRCFFDIQVGAQRVGRIIFELYSEICPKTCDNFRALCTGEKGNSETSGKPLHYKGAPFHRVINNFMIQAGDFTNGDGTGGESIYGNRFPDENFERKHDKEYLLSMANSGKNTNGSQFFITTRPCPHLDGIHVVFGEVIQGEAIVKLIESTPVDAASRPKTDIIIANCGELVLQRKSKPSAPSTRKRRVSSSTSSRSSSSSDSDRDRSRGRHRKRRRSRSVKDKKDENKDKEDEKKEFCSVNPAEIPDVPSNKFLMRNVPNDQEKKGPNMKSFVSKSGRKIKGRGSLRYRTPSRSRSRDRSATPPHWRREQNRTRRDAGNRRSPDRDRRRDLKDRTRRRSRDQDDRRRSRDREERSRRSRDRKDDSRRDRSDDRRNRNRSRDRGRDKSAHDRDRNERSRRDRSDDDKDEGEKRRDTSKNDVYKNADKSAKTASPKVGRSQDKKTPERKKSRDLSEDRIRNGGGKQPSLESDKPKDRSRVERKKSLDRAKKSREESRDSCDDKSRSRERSEDRFRYQRSRSPDKSKNKSRDRRSRSYNESKDRSLERDRRSRSSGRRSTSRDDQGISLDRSRERRLRSSRDETPVEKSKREDSVLKSASIKERRSRTRTRSRSRERKSESPDRRDTRDKNLKEKSSVDTRTIIVQRVEVNAEPELNYQGDEPIPKPIWDTYVTPSEEKRRANKVSGKYENFTVAKKITNGPSKRTDDGSGDEEERYKYKKDKRISSNRRYDDSEDTGDSKNIVRRGSREADKHVIPLNLPSSGEKPKTDGRFENRSRSGSRSKSSRRVHSPEYKEAARSCRKQSPMEVEGIGAQKVKHDETKRGKKNSRSWSSSSTESDSVPEKAVRKTDDVKKSGQERVSQDRRKTGRSRSKSSGSRSPGRRDPQRRRESSLEESRRASHSGRDASPEVKRLEAFRRRSRSASEEGQQCRKDDDYKERRQRDNDDDSCRRDERRRSSRSRESEFRREENLERRGRSRGNTEERAQKAMQKRIDRIKALGLYPEPNAQADLTMGGDSPPPSHWKKGQAPLKWDRQKKLSTTETMFKSESPRDVLHSRSPSPAIPLILPESQVIDLIPLPTAITQATSEQYDPQEKRDRSPPNGSRGDRRVTSRGERHISGRCDRSPRGGDEKKLRSSSQDRRPESRERRSLSQEDNRERKHSTSHSSVRSRDSPRCRSSERRQSPAKPNVESPKNRRSSRSPTHSHTTKVPDKYANMSVEEIMEVALKKSAQKENVKRDKRLKPSSSGSSSSSSSRSPSPKKSREHAHDRLVKSLQETKSARPHPLDALLSIANAPTKQSETKSPKAKSPLPRAYRDVSRSRSRSRGRGSRLKGRRSRSGSRSRDGGRSYSGHRRSHRSPASGRRRGRSRS